MSQVVIPLNAFSNEKGLEKDLDFYITIIANSNADGIEIRKELLNAASLTHDLQQIHNTLKDHHLLTVYSAPIPLWKEDTSLNEERVSAVMEEAKQIQAKWIKLPLGNFDIQKSNLKALSNLLDHYPTIQLLIENDQTREGGRIDPLFQFFQEAEKQNVPVHMTFDVGNWMYTNEDAHKAASLLSPYVSYYHVKHVIQQNQKLLTVPIKNGNELWKEINDVYFSAIPRALEFPIFPDSASINRYIEIINGDHAERMSS
ncbi:sugar phosphate isomerase/epimerase [Terrilactibacillus sp. BCM23-1]|uniref:Sugar phosphate isomerase/epimerase n=1 Tax=Terrilactibacillus tamarindi TaxID=2599694 RepID=A0A6N8CQH8_9BACI|nr:sugar phosphate isomerase/epimerase [Terrilactibacillus tamarindi]MTT32404.1 sugar phosphate isomerase/epimerase [Terrilactibacillus tamarindi]